MPRHRTKDRRPVFLELPLDLIARLDAEARRHGRPRVAEVKRALERHLASPEPVILPLADQKGATT